MNQSSTTIAAKDLEDFVAINGEHYHGVLAQVLYLTEQKEELCRIYDLSFGENDISLLGACKGNDFIRLRWLDTAEM